MIRGNYININFMSYLVIKVFFMVVEFDLKKQMEKKKKNNKTNKNSSLFLNMFNIYNLLAFSGVSKSTNKFSVSWSFFSFNN